MYQLEELKEDLDELLSKDPRSSLGSAIQRSTQESKALEYFLDQFSNLFAICHQILENDDDGEKLKVLL